MTKVMRKVTIAMSEKRQRINALLNSEADPTEEERAELTKLTDEIQGLEVEFRAAVAAEENVEPGETEKVEATEDTETRERRELRSKARVSDFVTAVLTGRPVTGASGEYADAVGVPGFMPLDLLETPGAAFIDVARFPEVEKRAITPGPADDTVTATQPTVPFAFARTDAAALGIAMPMVAPGEQHYPALSTAPPAGPKAADGAAAQTAAAFTLTKRDPKRITGQFLIRLEDLALLPSMEEDLRRGIASAMADSLDAQVINGNGSSPNLSGLFNQSTDVAVDGTKETFGTAIERFAGVVDGKQANGFGDIRALIGVATFALYAAIFANSNKGDISAYDHLTSKLGMLRVSTRVPAVASNGQKAIAVLGAQGQPISVPIWRGIELIVDPYTQAAKGQRVVTAVTLIGSPFIPYGTAQAIEVHPKLS